MHYTTDFRRGKMTDSAGEFAADCDDVFGIGGQLGMRMILTDSAAARGNERLLKVSLLVGVGECWQQPRF
jgi:hypothetical protein